jgi:hypothetical protein
MFKKFVATTLVALFASSANANVIINPTVGLNTSVNWGGAIGTGLFLPVQAFGSPGNTAFITVANAGTIDFSISDGGIAGDAFALQLDGVNLAPTSGNFGANTRGPSASSYFSAFYNDIVLSAGSHTFSLFFTDSCCSSGGTSASFSAVTPSVAAAVPEPTTVALLGLGMLGFAASRRKSRKDKGI